MSKERLGCNSHSCYLEKPTGWGVNGPCSCLDGLSIAKSLQLKKYLHKLRNSRQEAIKKMKEIERELIVLISFQNYQNYRKRCLPIVKGNVKSR